MKSKLSLCLLALVVLALVLSTNATAANLSAATPETATALTSSETATAPTLEITTAPMCSAQPSFGELPAFLNPTLDKAAVGCSPSQCDASCRAQGYDFGVCLITYCICRFYFP